MPMPLPHGVEYVDVGGNKGSIKINRGVILYSGGGIKTCLSKFRYMGQSGNSSDGKILYLSTGISAPAGYAQRENNKGVLKQFRVKEDIFLHDISAELLFYDYNELAQFCQAPFSGYYLDWKWKGNIEDIEVALCDAPSVLEYVGCRKQDQNEFTTACGTRFCETEKEFEKGGTMKKRTTRGRKVRRSRRSSRSAWHYRSRRRRL